MLSATPSSTIETVAGGGVGDGLPALNAAIDGPSAVAADSSGDLFIAEDNRIREVDHTTGIITTVAGNGTLGFSGDGGPGSAAELDRPTDIAVDASGDLFILDSDGIHEVDHATSIIITVVSSAPGFSGDGGPATAAELNDPRGIAVDSSGDLFIADSGNNRIREVDHATGIITTVAGNGATGFSGDGGPATAAEIYAPQGIAVDSSGDVFIANPTSGRIREVDHVTGVITTVAGNGMEGFSGDGGPATAAQLYGPARIAVDSSGDLFIADNNRIREVDHTTSVINTVAGDGTAGFSGDGGAATAAQLNAPSGIAVDLSGNLFIADADNNRIREMDHATGVIGTVAGNGTISLSGDGGPATAAEIGYTVGIAVDSSGDIFIADENSDRIREVDHATGVITTVAGGGTSGLGDGGPATAAQLNDPIGVAVDSSDNLFIADTDNNCVREVDHATGVITTVAGNGIEGFSGDGGPATAAQIYGPEGVAVDSSGDLFIVDSGNHRIREVDHATGVITTVAGGGTSGPGDGGPATAAQLYGPEGVAVDSSGDLFIADFVVEYQSIGKVSVAVVTNLMRKVAHATGVITTVVDSSGTEGFSGDGGPATAAQVDTPIGVAVDSSGDLFIADSGNNRIREVDHATGIITTVAGNGETGFSGDGGPATAAELNRPQGVAVDSSGNLFIAEGNRIREMPIPLVIDTGVYVVGSGTVSVAAANGLLANDSGTGQLTVTSGTVMGAEGGTFVFNADGSFTYTRSANFPGFDYAQYGATDTAGDQGTATVDVLSQSGGVIWKFFEQVLHRNPAPSDLAFFIPQLAQYGSGVLSSFFFETPELLNQIITGFYQQYLGRAPQGNDLPFWGAAWRAYGGPELIIAQFASSQEFNTLANNQYGAGTAGWVTALYERILNRVPRPGIDVPFWQQQLANGTTEGQVALDFVASQEGFGDDVTGWFSEYLGRAPTAAEQAVYVNQMLAGASDRTIEEAITSLGEYANEPSASPEGTGVRLPDYVPPWSSTTQQSAAVSAKDAVFSELGR